ncbi:MAG: helix-turn-helix domain-containing protein [Solirubrobacteraceae bacterium]
MTQRSDDHVLAAALVELLAASPAAVSRLRELVEPDDPPATTLSPPAYTVASLASTLNMSARAIRGAIARGELEAAKRGGRWIISTDAVRAWARADDGVPSDRRLGRSNGRAPLRAALALLDSGRIPPVRRYDGC